MTNITKLEDLIEKEVQIYPGDTYGKWGTIIDINNNGVLFKITRVEPGCTDFKVGTVKFISYSANLAFSY